MQTSYHFKIKSYPQTFGYILPSVAAVLRNIPSWTLDDSASPRTLTLDGGNTEAERSEALARTTTAMRQTGHFRILDGWRDELLPVFGSDTSKASPRQKEVLLSMERAASALFGIITYGVHLTAYTRDPSTSELQIWVPRRAATKQTYGGMLDNTVAGGIATGEAPFESLVRECAEEASLPEDLVRSRAKAVGAVTYYHIRDKRAGGETGLLQPECQYVYDLELDPQTVPRPCDEEVAGFELMGVEDVKGALREGEFKPNCAMVLLDFFVRHGLITAEGEEAFVEIVSRLHRRLEFPTA